MAIGDAARKAGYPLVPDEGEDGKVRHGAREINRTRDIIAEFASRVPTSTAAMRSLMRITSGREFPSGGQEGDIHFKVE